MPKRVNTKKKKLEKNAIYEMNELELNESTLWFITKAD